MPDSVPVEISSLVIVLHLQSVIFCHHMDRTRKGKPSGLLPSAKRDDWNPSNAKINKSINQIMQKSYGPLSYLIPRCGNGSETPGAWHDAGPMWLLSVLRRGERESWNGLSAPPSLMLRQGGYNATCVVFVAVRVCV